MNPSAAEKSEAMIQQSKRGIEGDTPYEIRHIILLRLPVKSLLRFRCVGKSLLAFDRQSILRFGYNRRKTNDLDSIAFDCSDDSEQKLCFPCKESYVLKCSWNGIVVLSLRKEPICVLWNPSTKAYKKFSLPDQIYKDYALRGLGLVGTSDPPTFMYGDSYGDDLLYDASPSRTNQYECVIVYFDTVDHKFREMPPPNCINEGDMFDLTVLKGCLSLYFSTIDRNYFEVWTMEQYGERNSWTKLIVIPR
ncbi:F-box/kelch-repeat protein At3g23880-like [Cornus florida]|uniref:F-box/kelch-repeat protein At3g23880-like n=1 Tax=Cornus florida TaxID=4283 RepID=UPI00289941D4|nr:F-box/kelch-repeat protein At3g23880-like [Cornus florida]